MISSQQALIRTATPTCRSSRESRSQGVIKAALGLLGLLPEQQPTRRHLRDTVFDQDRGHRRRPTIGTDHLIDPTLSSNENTAHREDLRGHTRVSIRSTNHEQRPLSGKKRLDVRLLPTVLTRLRRDRLVPGSVLHHVRAADHLAFLVADGLGVVHLEAVDGCLEDQAT